MEKKKKTNLLDLANKGKGKTTTKSTIKTKGVVKKEENKIVNPEEERNLKAKQKVEELLNDVKLVPDDKKKNDTNGVIVLDETQDTKNITWFEEQLQKLSAENEILKKEAEIAKGDYIRILEENKKIKFGDIDVGLKGTVIRLFNELQNNYIQMGINPTTGFGNFTIYTPGFLNRMISFFPFLSEHRKY